VVNLPLVFLLETWGGVDSLRLRSFRANPDLEAFRLWKAYINFSNELGREWFLGGSILRNRTGPKAVSNKADLLQV